MGFRASREAPAAARQPGPAVKRKKHAEGAGLNRLRPYLLLLIVSLILYLPVMKQATEQPDDFGAHTAQALELPDTTTHVVHVLFHAIFLLLYRLAPFLSQSSAALVAILLLMLPVPIMVYGLLKAAAQDSLPTAVLIALSLAVTIAAPITVWTLQFNLGYINPIVYHNATSIAARLFVIPLSLLAYRIFLRQPYRDLNHRVYILLLSAVVVLLATLAKPSFVFALLPACCLFALWRSFRRQAVDWLLLVCGTCLPGLVLMGILYLLAYESQDRSSTIAFGLFATMQTWIPTWRIPLQFLLSLVFPLAVFALYFNQARRHLYLKLCWVIFAVAAAMAYSLYESGPRISHGNFIWGSYNAIFLLMFASLQFVLEQHSREIQLGCGRWKIFGARVSRNVALALLLFGLHVVSGIAYYYRYVT